MLIKDVGICLARRDYSETSQLATIFTRARGKIRGIAKGSRRSKSKFGSGIELLSQGQVVFSLGRGGGLLTLAEWTAQQSYRGLRGSLEQLYRAYYLAELVDLFTEELDPHPGLYEFFSQALDELAVGQGWADFLIFQLRLLREVGLIPGLFDCACCGKGLAGEAGKYLSFSEGGMLCGPCGSAVAEKWPITPVGLRILGDLSGALDSGRPADPSQADARRSQELLDYWIRAALNREPKTAHLLR